MTVPSVSVLMPCRNAIPYLEEAIASVLRQPECLELLIADGGSTDGSLVVLERWAQNNPRVKIISRSDNGPADALNKAFKAARGTLIGWLNADDLYPQGAFARAVTTLNKHPTWLMLYGEGVEFNSDTGLLQRYPTQQPSAGIEGFKSHCFICQPTVLFRRSMGLMLGTFDEQWKTSFDFDYWLRAFEAFPHRIGYIPYLQGCTRLHENTITNTERSQVALEATKLIARHFGSAPATRIHNFGMELQLGLAETKPEQTHSQLLKELTNKAAPWIEPSALEKLRHDWQLNDVYRDNVKAPTPPTQSKTSCEKPLTLRLLQALHPQLHPHAPGSTVEQETRCQQFIDIHRKHYRLLDTDGTAPTAESFFTDSEHNMINRPFGVNLIGHAYEMFGIGEDIRMAARALQSADVPCCVIYHPSDNGAACTDRSLEPLFCRDPNGGPYAFNLVCMAAPIYARWLLKTGLDPIRGRYTIGAWPWETCQWPELWNSLLEVVDEVWPSSTFTAKALQEPAAQLDVPLTVMPMAAEIPEPNRFCSTASRELTRNRLGISNDAVVFVYSFDLNSTVIRKNPMAALEAFQQAFPLPHLLSSEGNSHNTHPLSDRVALLIKTFPPLNFSPEWNWLQLRAKEDPRIHVLEANLERDELLAVYGCCDAFLSLHRSEGFGRSMAEALQLGLDVIATDYGGNTDFCQGPLTHPIRCKEVPIPRGSYPYADGHYWSEPNIVHATKQMQKVAKRRIEIAHNINAADPSRNAMVLSNYREQFSFRQVGYQYRRKLESIWDDLGHLNTS